MKLLPTPLLDRLSISVSRLSIRRAHTQKRYKQPQPQLTFFAPGHGEQIWVFNDERTNQIVYSHKPAMDSYRALAQIPFNGKKLKPPKLRRDHWHPMALIQFGKGEGIIGRSVFQKLREFRRLHELSWGWQAKELLGMSKKDRGRTLNNQKANSVADMAAVLGGAGKGNRIWLADEESGAEKGAEKEAVKGDSANRALAPVTVFWANQYDMQFAKRWPKTVTHHLGLPRRTSKPDEKVEDAELLATTEAALPETTATPT